MAGALQIGSIQIISVAWRFGRNGEYRLEHCARSFCPFKHHLGRVLPIDSLRILYGLPSTHPLDLAEHRCAGRHPRCCSRIFSCRCFSVDAGIFEICIVSVPNVIFGDVSAVFSRCIGRRPGQQRLRLASVSLGGLLMAAQLALGRRRSTLRPSDDARRSPFRFFLA